MLNQLALRTSHKALLTTTALLTPPAALVAYAQDTDHDSQQHQQQHQQQGMSALHRATTVMIPAKVIPVLEASGRAMRLIGTASSILFDYQCAKYAPRVSLSLSSVTNSWKALTPTAADTRPGEGDDAADEQTEMRMVAAVVSLQERQVKLEHTVTERAHDLWEAQQRYAVPLSSVPSSSRDSKETLQRAVHDAARDLAKAEQDLATFEAKHSSSSSTNSADTDTSNDSSATITTMNQVHTRAAQKLVTLCRQNAGVYIKIGQHLANLDHLLPQPYLTALATLYNQAPTSSLASVHKVLMEEFNVHSVDQLFDDFQEIPLASASLAQVHVATHPVSGRKLAIKIQHDGLRETSKGDLWALEAVVRLIDLVCQDFTLGWLVEEISPNLPKELDFVHEAHNSERAAKHLQEAGLGFDCIVPKIHWEYTTPRVLCMDFEEGYIATDVHAMEREGVSKRNVSHLIAQVFQSQVFQSGFVHCDPHPANVLWRKHPNNKRPQLVLVDHGLYKQLDEDFRITYAKLWKGLLLADLPLIKSSCERLLTQEERIGGADQEAQAQQTNQLFPLLAAMLTSRPFDEIVERSKTQAIGGQSPTRNYTAMDSKSDTAMIRSYAQQYLPQIISMLDVVPRQMLLLFKLNDCLRHLDLALESSPTHSLLVAGRYAVKAVYDDTIRSTRKQQQQQKQQQEGNYETNTVVVQEGTSSNRGVNSKSHGLVKHCQEWCSYVMILSRIRVYELISHWWHIIYSSKRTLQSGFAS